MHADHGNKITGKLSGESARYATDAGCRSAITKVEKAEAEKQVDLERAAGRPLTVEDISRGGVPHPETRTAREIAKSRINVTARPSESVDGVQRALEYGEQKLAEANLSHRERTQLAINRSLQQQVRKPTTPPSPETVKRINDARKFAQLVAFTTGTTVAQVERAAALADVADNAEAFTGAMNSLRSDIRDTLSVSLPEIDASAAAIRERASMFAPEPTRPTGDLSRFKLVAPWGQL